MYQEATYRLMMFRTNLKDKQVKIADKQKTNEQYSNAYLGKNVNKTDEYDNDDDESDRTMILNDFELQSFSLETLNSESEDSQKNKNYTNDNSYNDHQFSTSGN
jgi:hypothetical protein